MTLTHSYNKDSKRMLTLLSNSCFGQINQILKLGQWANFCNPIINFLWLLDQFVVQALYFFMFQLEPKKTLKIQNSSKKRVSSRPRDNKRQGITTLQSVAFQVSKKNDRKTKSQCFSKQHSGERNTLNAYSKTVKTARPSAQKRGRERGQNYLKVQEQLHTQNRIRHQSFLISNLNTEKSADIKWKKKPSWRKITECGSVEKKALWNQKLVPYEWQYVVEHYGHYLSKYQLNEIKEYNKIYYIGHKTVKEEAVDFDTSDKLYKYVDHDHIAYRYQILCTLGKGSYGQVLKVFDHKNKEQVAIKIIKNECKCSKQAFLQIKILSHIKEVDPQQQSNIVRVKDFVVFRKHVCILFELLSDNLYQLIVRNNYNGLNQELVRRFAIQILVGLQFMRKQEIIHCDLKPENILLKDYNKSGIKIIDLGSSCFQNQIIYTYIQSRYYRAPQITLGIPYNNTIDIWSTGCILAELYLGVPIFPADNEFEQIKYMIDALGPPSWILLSQAKRKNLFFDQEDNIRAEVSRCQTHEMFGKPLKERIEDKDFFSFIQGFLRWDPQERITPNEGLAHPWIKKGVSQLIKSKHSTSNNALKKEVSKGSTSKRVNTKSKEKGSNMISAKNSKQRLRKTYALKY